MHSFRSLKVWQCARRLSLLVLEETDKHNHHKTWALFDQLRRAAVSVELNIVEGYALQTTAQFRRHLGIALASAAEAECVLELVESRAYLPRDACRQLLDLTANVLKLLFGLMRSRSGK